MSLKAMHIVFITCSILLCFFLGAWLLNDVARTHDGTERIAGWVSCGGGVLLIIYARAILRKLRQISFL